MIGSSAATVSLSIDESSRVGEARRLAAVMAGSLGFSATGAGKVGIVVTEAAANLFKHAQEGELLLRAIEHDGITGLEILSLDKGPGMPDVEKCLADGFSTAGSPGTGLGAMARVASFFDIHSQPRIGTAILIRLWSKPPPEPARLQVEIGGVSVPVAGEQLCGDGWAAVQSREQTMLMVADGLGHGQFASEAAEEAVRIFRENSHRAPAEIVDCAHGALRATRGAAMAVAEISRGSVRYAGVGNIGATILSRDASRSLMSYNGIVGHELRKLQELTYPWPPDGLLIMHSDGLQTKWTLNSCPGIQRHHPALAAGVLYRDFRRERDDVTVVVCRAMV